MLIKFADMQYDTHASKYTDESETVIDTTSIESFSRFGEYTNVIMKSGGIYQININFDDMCFLIANFDMRCWQSNKIETATNLIKILKEKNER